MSASELGSVCVDTLLLDTYFASAQLYGTFGDGELGTWEGRKHVNILSLQLPVVNLDLSFNKFYGSPIYASSHYKLV